MGHSSFQSLALERVSLGLACVNGALCIVEANRAFADLVASSEAMVIGAPVARLFPRCSLAVEALIRDALQGQSCTDKEIVEDAEAGVGRVLRVSTFRFDDDADGAGVGIIIDDITERWRLKQSLRATSNLYAMLLRSNQAISRCRNAPELYASICRVAVDTGHFRFAWIGVPSGGRIVPLAQAGIDNGYMRELVVTLDDDDPRSHGPTATSYKTGQSVVVNDFLSASQTLPWHGAAKRAGIAASATFAIPERGQVVAVLTLYATAVNFFTPELVATLSELPSSIAVALDAYLHEQERKRGEAELLLRDRAIRAVSQGICITDAQAVGHPIIYASPGFIAMTGYPLDEVIGRNCRFLQGEDTEPEAVQALRQALQARRECTVELLNYRRDGSPFWNSVAISPIRDEAGAISHFVGVQTDITERRKLDHQVRQSQKMEAIGRLAGGVAHDFNNILSVINGYSSLLLSRDLAPAQQRHGLEEINKAGSRAANLTSQLLAFSRQQVVRAQVLDLNSLVEDLSNMLARLLGEDMSIELLLADDLWMTKADRGQLDQVLINFAVNARDAMPGGGRLAIATCNEVFAAPTAVHREIIPAGEYVALSVCDSGTGMDAQTVSRIFDPFFTTKDVGKGTGLGLSTVYGIVRQWQGWVTVDSRPGEGTTFRVYLPRAQETVKDSPTEHASDAPSGAETILLAEDEDALRYFLRCILVDAGYHVLEACDGSEALALASEYAGPIHALISDVVMPKLGGRALVEQLREVRPRTRVLLLSGYVDDVFLRSGAMDSKFAIVPKPIASDALLRLLRDLLDAREDAEASA
jgi:two-component system cell cycle sensor histidine kinase/response regulator CckA